MPRGAGDGVYCSALPGEFPQDKGLADAREEGNHAKRGDIESPEPVRGGVFTAIAFHIGKSWSDNSKIELNRARQSFTVGLKFE